MSEEDVRSSAAIVIDGRNIWVPMCKTCGAFIADEAAHEKWHRQQRTAHIIGPGLLV